MRRVVHGFVSAMTTRLVRDRAHLRAKAVQHLERLRAGLQAMTEPPFEQSDENVRQWRTHATGAAEGFWAVGLLSPEEFEAWVDQLRSVP